MPEMREIPLRELKVAPDNVRKTPPTQAAQDELKASIKAHGLLQNLVVVPNIDRSMKKFPWLVVTGGRRLAALLALAKEKAAGYSLDTPIPCRVQDEAAWAAEEMGLAENTVRAAMHPADQYEAFVQLRERGAEESDIAASFGVSVAVVRQRLKLGRVAPALLDHYRAGILTLDHVMAFTISDDHERQMAVFKRLSTEPWAFEANHVRHALTQDKASLSSAMGRYVGRKAYEKGGGTITEDLFQDHDVSYFDDVELLRELAVKKLDKGPAAKIRLEGWKWVEVTVEHANTHGLRRHVLEPSKATDEEAKELENIERELTVMNEADGDLTEEQESEWQNLEERQREIQAQINARQEYTEDQKATGGCLVFLNYRGQPDVIRGLVKPEDTADDDDGAGEQEAPKPRQTNSRSAEANAAAEKRKAAGVNNLLNETLRCIRASMVKTTLVEHPDLAHDLLAFQIGRRALLDRPDYNEAPLHLDINEGITRPLYMTGGTKTWDEESPGEALFRQEKERVKKHVDWLDNERPIVECWAAFRMKPAEYKAEVLTYGIAWMTRAQMAFDDGNAMSQVLESAIAEMDPRFEIVRPSADLFWSQLSKAALMGVLRETVGDEYAASHSKLKKEALAEHVEQLMANPSALCLKQDAINRVNHWMPPGFKA